ncbi:Polyphosphate:AMP/ADP phosphotransferase [Streptomyces sp. RB5]|uniref:Polyphosphate:AMP/ADP phosphotransferase n=1 Tax=Streptomyces smaragdinus TaxID=2585196 RepID=A0A7K0CPY3_9ACTN|nr:PPK2 family polyphosphate kinase [Streptomyces smaragdinus]MQY15550.1 Polyphosphate:AMP/ADP phosphotransferase [Streptomyces smaragdinus]
MAKSEATDLRELLRVPPGGPLDLGTYDPRATPAGPRNKAAGRAAVTALGPELAGLQERLFAAATAGDRRRLLLVLQGMDTSGKGGTVKHVVKLFDPSGCRIRSFKSPTDEERRHHFLWRIGKQLPQSGEIGVFDRSHYEDVLVVRVRGLVPREVWSRRYDEINRFEESLAADGVTLVKCFLHISREEQRRRLLARLDNPAKRWKFDPVDIDERRYWAAYREAYAEALALCNPDHAPWYIVPGDRKWYRDWAVSRLLLEHLTELDPRYPPPSYDVDGCRARLLGERVKGRRRAG